MKILNKLLILLLALLFFSCKKESNSPNTPDSYVKIKKDGNWITYAAVGELGVDLDDDTKTNFSISASSTDQKEFFSTDIQIEGSNLPTGTYSSDVYSPYFVLVNYALTPDPSTIKNYSNDDAPNKGTSKYVINITSITSTELSGTFTGNYLYDDFSSADANGGVVQITEGEFKVKRLR